MAFLGKISRLPAELRNEVCRKLYDGVSSADILRELNAKSEVKKILTRYFNGEEISAQNLTAFKQSGFAEWLKRREKLTHLMELSKYATSVAKSSKNLAASSAAILSGKLLEVVDALDIENGDPEQLKIFISALTKLQNGELQTEKLNNERLRLRYDAEKLHLEKKKFQRQTAELFIKFCEDARAKEIALSSASKRVKMDSLVRLMFGTPPAEGNDGK